MITGEGFALYRLAGETEVSFIKGPKSPLESLGSASGFVFTDFNRINSFFINPATYQKASWETLKGKLTVENLLPSEVTLEESTPEEDYEFGFKIVQNEIDYKTIKKAILSRKIVLNQTSSPVELFDNLVKAYPSSHIYLVRGTNGDVWVGATPETLLKENNGKCQTMSLAGTKKDEETQWTDKEYEEQKIVTRTIENALSELNIKSELGDLETVKAGAVYHLRNLITFDKGNALMPDIAEKLHPTPAISGSPKSAAYSTIKIAENHSREFYCGFGGPIGLGEENTLFVNLRCAKITKNQVILFVGGGITKNSILENEWAECERKAQSLLRFL